MISFKEAYAKHYVVFDCIDAWINDWHSSSTEESLGAYLGLTVSEYKLFVEQGYSALKVCLDNNLVQS